jgi:hypothetical protein
VSRPGEAPGSREGAGLQGAARESRYTGSTTCRPNFLVQLLAGKGKTQRAGCGPLDLGALVL